MSGLSAREASRPVAGANLAAHARHVIFSIDAYLKAVETAEESYIAENWPEWDERGVTTTEWQAIKEQLPVRVEALLDFFRQEKGGDLPLFAFGALAHMSFHLGMIRVKCDELGRA